jgi:hypothetical protein
MDVTINGTTLTAPEGAKWWGVLMDVVTRRATVQWYGPDLAWRSDRGASLSLPAEPGRPVGTLGTVPTARGNRRYGRSGLA